MNDDQVRKNPTSSTGQDAMDEEQVYQIRIKGHINSGWSEWFCGLSISRERDGTTTLTGPVADQPALHGILARIRDLGMHLLAVQQLGTREGDPNQRGMTR